MSVRTAERPRATIDDTEPPWPAPAVPRRERQRPGRGGRAAGYLALGLAAIVVGAPLLWMVLASFKAPDELYTIPMQWLPGQLNLDNYAEAAAKIPLGTLVLNSVGLTIAGAGHWRRLWRIVVPMSTPTIAAVGLVSVVSEWNEYLWPFLVTDDAAKMTLPVGLTLLQNIDGLSNWGVLLAATTVVTLPVLAVFLVMQRRLVAGLTAGAVTG